jgi:hypothetical protein
MSAFLDAFSEVRAFYGGAASPAEHAAFNAGVEAVRQMALIAAVTIEARGDAKEVRQRAAAAALVGLAEGAAQLLAPKPNPVLQAFTAIAEQPGSEGVIPCPACAGRLHWTRAESNGHVWGQCETDGCLSWMQ